MKRERRHRQLPPPPKPTGGRTRLVITRRLGQTFVANGPCEVTITEIEASRVQLAIVADPSVKILRSEILERERKQDATD